MQSLFLSEYCVAQAFKNSMEIDETQGQLICDINKISLFDVLVFCLNMNQTCTPNALRKVVLAVSLYYKFFFLPRTLALIKPDGMCKMGELFDIIINAGLTITKAKMMLLSR